MIQNPVNFCFFFSSSPSSFFIYDVLHWHEPKSSQTKRWRWARARRFLQGSSDLGNLEFSRGMLFFFLGENVMY